MSRNWYILYVNVGQEIKLARQIKMDINEGEYAGYVGQIKVPTESVIQSGRNGQKKQVEKTFLSGYILIEMELTNDKSQWLGLCSYIHKIKGVKKIVGFERNQKPIPISSKDIRHIFERMGELKSQEPTYSDSYVLGDKVKIINGPFNNFNGIVEEINYEKAKLKVSVQIFGRSTPVYLNFNQIEEIF